jgi:hypothetical protein
MAATVVQGTVNSLGAAYKDETPSVEIRVPLSRAKGLPFQEGARGPVRLKIGTQWYDARLHASAGTTFVYFSPTLSRFDAETTLGHVLTRLHVRVNDRVQLKVYGAKIHVCDKWGNGLKTSAAVINRAIGIEPKPLTQIRSESGMEKSTRFYPHIKSLRDSGLVKRLNDGRYAENDGPADSTIVQRILGAVAAIVGEDLTAHFRRVDVREHLGLSPALWSKSHSPLFQGMRIDHPGGAPHVAEEYRGVFRRVTYGVYTLTDNGRLIVGQLVPPKPAPANTETKTGGGGFGTPENNAAVEAAARQAVWDMYEADHWTVKTVEKENLGYDLVCRKGEREEHVEVKGTSGVKESFPITANEVRAAREDETWHLCVVTSALSPATREISTYDRDEFLVRFDLKVLQYMAKLAR